MANRYMQRDSKVSNHQENADQNHSEIYDLTPVKMLLKKNKRQHVIAKDVEKLESLYILLVRMQNGTAAVRNSMKLPQKIKSRTTK